jgi:hypothetical protein
LRCFQQTVSQRAFAVVDVRDDRKISDFILSLHTLCHTFHSGEKCRAYFPAEGEFFFF